MVVIAEGLLAGGEGYGRLDEGHGARRLLSCGSRSTRQARHRGDPLSRVFACAGGRVSAPARFARLIARMRGRHRTHFACRLNRGRSAPGRRGRDAVHGRRFPWTHHSTLSENASHTEKYYIHLSNNAIRHHYSARPRPGVETLASCAVAASLPGGPGLRFSRRRRRRPSAARRHDDPGKSFLR